MKPRYAELAQQMIREIGAGKFAVGTALPSELELSAQYGVSRSTVRSALQVVQDLGLISRRKRAGIRVEAIKPRHAYAQSLSSVEDLVQFAAETERHVQSIEEIVFEPALATQLGYPDRLRWLRVALLRIDPHNPALPICWTDVYLDPAVGTGLRRDLRKSSGLICEMVEEKYGRLVAEIRQEIRAIGVPEPLAKKLGAPAGSHALEIVRHYIDQQGVAFEVTVSVFPADRLTYTLQLRRQPGA